MCLPQWSTWLRLRRIFQLASFFPAFSVAVSGKDQASLSVAGYLQMVVRRESKPYYLRLVNIEDTNSPTGRCRNTKREIAAALADRCTTSINMPVLVANVHML